MKTCRIWSLNRNKKEDVYILSIKEPKKIEESVSINKVKPYFFDPFPNDDKNVEGGFKDITQNLEKYDSGEKLKSYLTKYSVSKGDLIHIFLKCDLRDVLRKMIIDFKYKPFLKDLDNKTIFIYREELLLDINKKFTDYDKQLKEKKYTGLVIIYDKKDYHFGAGSFEQIVVMLDDLEIKQGYTLV